MLVNRRGPVWLNSHLGEIDRRPGVAGAHREADHLEGGGGAGGRGDDIAAGVAIGDPQFGARARHHDEFVDADRDRRADRRAVRARHDLESASGHLDHGARRRVLRQMDGDAVDGDELHHHRILRWRRRQLQILGQAAGIGQPPDFAVRLGDRDGRKLLAADGEVPVSASVIVAAVAGVVRGPDTSPAALRRGAGNCVQKVRSPPGSAPRRRRPLRAVAENDVPPAITRMSLSIR